ncbi:amidohydrolase family protein [Burkholderia sp. S171]|uniref:amidohydrolase family protein n=1 Tax=Burkholderia sp. S171 TaxID=1641860 RepID=UPI00131B7DF8|nr:amidohydrolase family protein [Burkholderia sp. S171]
MIDLNFGLVDHHCHGTIKSDLDRKGLEGLMSESYLPPPPGTSHFDKPLGLLIRRHCAPVLDLEPFADPDTYVARRLELGAQEVSRRLLCASGIDTYLVDTGHRSARLTDPFEVGQLGAAAACEVVRIEAVIESVARNGDAASFARRCEAELRARVVHAVGLKSVVAYRATFKIDQTRPSAHDVEAAAGQWLASMGDGAPRLMDPVLLRFGLFLGLDICREKQFPLQLHVGFGDPDVYMHACDPTHFTDFLKVTEEARVPVTLLHNYPFIREAGWLSEIFQNVYYDVGAILNFLGPSAVTAMRHAMEMGPFSKQLFSSDAFGLPELHFLGALQFRKTLGIVLDEWIADGACTAKDAEQIAASIAFRNARRIYPLEGTDRSVDLSLPELCL